MTKNVTEFAKNWIASWNSHDIENILSHYSEDVEINTPMLKKVNGTKTGVLKGKKSVGGYWSLALLKFPDLKFELIEVAEGVQSLSILYKSFMGLTAIEVMFFNSDGLVDKMIAHYTKANQ